MKKKTFVKIIIFVMLITILLFSINIVFIKMHMKPLFMIKGYITSGGESGYSLLGFNIKKKDRTRKDNGKVDSFYSVKTDIFPFNYIFNSDDNIDYNKYYNPHQAK